MFKDLIWHNLRYLCVVKNLKNPLKDCQKLFRGFVNSRRSCFSIFLSFQRIVFFQRFYFESF